MLPATILNKKALPPLITENELTRALTKAKDTKNAFASAIVMLIISGPIQKILSSFRHTQIIVHLMLIAVNQPATVLLFFGGLMNLVNF